MRRWLGVCTVVVACVVVSGAAGAQTTLFYDGFEDPLSLPGSWSWEPPDLPPDNLTVVSSPKPVNSGDHSLRQRAGRPGYSHYTTGTVHYMNPDDWQGSLTISAYFYDDLAPHRDAWLGVETTGAVPYGRLYYWLGLSDRWEPGYYSVHEFKQTGWVDRIYRAGPRTQGGHEFRAELTQDGTSFYVDDVLCGFVFEDVVTSNMDPSVWLISGWSNAPGEPLYWDDVSVVALGIEVNDPPEAVDDDATTHEDTPLGVAAPGVLGNDSDPDGDPLTAVLVAGPSDGTLALSAGGSFTYTPDANFNGSDSFTYKANDGELDSNVATVRITVAPVNDAPEASDDAYSVDEDNVLNVAAPGVLGNDSDVDGDALTAVLGAGVSNGTLALSADGSFTYTPDLDYYGEDSFTYMANDGELDSNVATVTITVNPVNDAPVIVTMTCPIDPVCVGTTVTMDATFTDPDPEDTHTGTACDWGDGSDLVPDSCTSPAGEPLGTVSDSHIYTVPGVYPVTLVVDDGTATDLEEFKYIVVYDPADGFVTGGGWIDSPVGAYADDPSLTGKATFGFVAKYKKGANVPTG